MFNILYDCTDPNFLRIVYFAKNAIDIIQIVVPILLILSLFLDAYKNVTSKEGWDKKIIKKMVVKIVAAALVFFVVPITSMVIQLFGESSIEQNDCWKNANKEYIKNAQSSLGDIDDIKPDIAQIEAALNKRLELYEELLKNSSAK